MTIYGFIRQMIAFKVTSFTYYRNSVHETADLTLNYTVKMIPVRSKYRDYPRGYPMKDTEQN